ARRLVKDHLLAFQRQVSLLFVRDQPQREIFERDRLGKSPSQCLGPLGRQQRLRGGGRSGPGKQCVDPRRLRGRIAARDRDVLQPQLLLQCLEVDERVERQLLRRVEPEPPGGRLVFCDGGDGERQFGDGLVAVTQQR